jgi:AcrR family transcriptional regulator
MGRRPNPVRRAELLERIADYIMAHGLADLSLRPLAKAVGTSGRMLVYHFGSKEQLLVAAIEAVRNRQQAAFLGAISEGGGSEEILRRTFEWSTAPEWDRYSRFFYAVFGIALQEPHRFPGFLETVQPGLRLMIQVQLQSNGYPLQEAEARATFYAATLRGLAIDILATHERERVDRALAVLSDVVAQAGRERRERPRAAKGPKRSSSTPAAPSRRRTRPSRR